MAAILIVEDDEDIRTNLARLLKLEGHAVVSARHGREALERAEVQPPELVITDLNMPEMGGFELLGELRREPRTAALPVLVLTALDDRVSMRRAMTAGADDVLAKPFTRAELLEAVDALLARRQRLAQAALSQPMVGGSLRAAPAAPAPPLPYASAWSAPLTPAGLEGDADVLRAPTAGRGTAAAAGGTLPLASQRAAPRLRGYAIERLIGSGGMTDVYLAQRQADGLRLVLKVLDSRAQGGSEHLSRFIQEYALLSQLNHPNVVRIHDQGFTDDFAFIAMEYFERGDLRSATSGPMAPAAALACAAQLAGALDAIHALGVVHRDLKPENVMLRANGSVALADFGIAKSLDGEDLLRLTQTRHGDIVGTPYYLSPEQAAGGAVSPRSDYYSLGVMLYELLTGQRPFRGATLQEILACHLHAPPPPLPVPLAALQPLVHRLMAKDPPQRAASAVEVLALIDQARGHGR